MNTNTIHKAVSIPSGFGMPVCGRAFRTATAGSVMTAVVREQATATTGDMGLIAYVPGPTAWSPPPS